MDAASGISVSRIKLAAFAIGGFLAGLGGAMVAYQQTTADVSSYTAMGGLAFFTTAYLAGLPRWRRQSSITAASSLASTTRPSAACC